MNTPLHWVAFNAAVIIAVALDLGVLRRKDRKIGLREALTWSLVWIGLAVCFGLGIQHFYGKQSSLEFFAGYVIEKSMSVDNLFVFLVIFRTFGVAEEYQHRVLEYGILGALLMRGAMIGIGATLLQRFSWISYVFGVFIVLLGARMLFPRRKPRHPEESFLARYLSRHLPICEEACGAAFFVRRDHRLLVTPLFLVLLVVEISDVTFAVDSIPAVFGVTRDPFIVYTSNVFAILGLRSLYFLLAGVLEKFALLHTGVALVLIFVGAKMISEPWVHISVGLSLIIILATIAASVVLSVAIRKETVSDVRNSLNQS